MAKSSWVDEIPQSHRARLFPVVKNGRLESRCVSIFLAVFSEVFEFRKSVLEIIDHSIGETTKVDCYTEVKPPINSGKLAHNTPDGLICLRRGEKLWRAFVEAKIESPLDHEQLIAYLKLARENDVHAVVSVSNDYATRPNHHPLQSKIPGTQTRSVSLYHLSWSALRTVASNIIYDNKMKDSASKFLVAELLRYLSHQESGVKRFDQMNQEWGAVVKKLMDGVNINRKDAEIEATVSHWHQEMRDLALEMSKGTHKNVVVKMSRSHEKHPEMRLKDDCAKLVDTNCLECELAVPDAAATIIVSTNLAKRRISCSMELLAPRASKQQRSSVNWLVRQINDVDSNTIVKIRWPRKSIPTTFQLNQLIDRDYKHDPIYIEDKSLLPASFEVEQSKICGREFLSRKKFVLELEKLIEDFYKQIGERLQPWVPRAPVLESPDSESISVDDPSSSSRELLPITST